MKDETLEAFLEPADPDFRVHAAWTTHVCEAADTSLSEQVPEGHIEVANVSMPTTSLGAPERSAEREVSQEPHFLRWSRPRRVVSIALALVGVGIAAQHFGLLSSSQEPNDHTTETLSSPTGPSTGIAATGTELGSPKLLVQSSPAVSGEPAPLGLAVWGAANGAVVLLRGLPPGMELSTGHAVANGVWQLSAAALPDAWIAPPVGFVGSTHLVAELQLLNSEIADRQAIHLEWKRGESPEKGTTTDAAAALQHPNDPALPTVRPDISPKPSGVGPSDPRPSSKRPRERRANDSRRSVTEDTRRVPSANRSVGDASRPPKGFWDWSR
jgi:hypothetical protein